MKVQDAVAGAGENAAVDVVVSNTGDAPASGQIAVRRAGRLDASRRRPRRSARSRSGESQTVTFHVAVPAGTEPGDYAVQAVVTSKRGTGAASGFVHVIGDVIEFTPFTSAEQPWLFDADGSQSRRRACSTATRAIADGNAHFTYRFDIPSDVTGGTLTLDIGNQYLVEVSPDNQTWTHRARGDGPDRRHRPHEPGRARRSTSTTSAAAAGRCTCASRTTIRRTAGAVGSRT